MSATVRAATDPGVSVWVSANAGAGKTHMLTDRVTRLLLAGAEPSRILCLTYTKAAAGEMATRLFDRLGQWALLPDAELRALLIEIGADPPDAKALRKARTLFAQALETPGGLKIQTIHSFCQHVLARFPVEAGIPARFTVLDERSAAELMAQARNGVLERAAKGDARLAHAAAVLATRAADGRFAEILDFAMGDSGKLRDLLARHGDEAHFFVHLRRTLDIAEGEDEAKVLTDFCAELGGEKPICERIARWLLAGSANDKKLGEAFHAFLAGGMSADNFESLHSGFFTDNNELRKTLVTKPSRAAAPDLAEHLERLKQRMQALEDRRRRAVTASLTEAVVTVALAVLETYESLKRGRAALDYDDLTRATLGLLQSRDDASWVLYKLDGGLDHILVDEAQDTSPDQWKIVGQLADEFFSGEGARDARGGPRTIFAVGDEKQSIFSFQGADPAGFGHHRTIFKARAEGAGLPFADLRPAVSRRSARSVLEFVDTVFGDEAAREGLTATGDPVHHDPHRADIGRVELWPAVKPPENAEPDPWYLAVDAPSQRSAHVVLASRIASRIAGWLGDGTALPGMASAIVPGDIMILVRRRNVFTAEMIRQLLDRGVPVAGADRMVLMEQIAILDLVALGRFVLLPDDDLNLAALLKSPLVGLPEDELFDLAQPREGRSLWEELRALRHERASFGQAQAFLAERLGEADFIAPFEFYARALGRGLRRRLVARLGDEAADAIDEFLSLALIHEASHPPSLEAFLNWFERGASDVKRDMEQAGGAVRVMTVHGAKGLEANIVILPDTVQAPDQERRGPLLYTEDCVYFNFAKAMETPPVTAAKNAARIRELREYRRLLYVAATRAREFLIVCGYEMRRKNNDPTWYKHLEAAARAIGREEEIDGESVIAYGAPLVGGTRAMAKERAGTALPAFFARPAAPEPPPRILRPSDAAGLDEPSVVSPLNQQGKRFQRGLLVHALLAHLPDIPAAERENAALSYLRRQGLDAGEAAALIAETFAIIGDPIFAPLFGADSRAEVAVAASLPELGDVRISGQIDRLAVTAEAVLIADFKTNRPPPQTAEDTPRLYLAQMALYRAALARIYPGKRIDCALVWTDGARLMPLPATLLDAEIARIASRNDPQNMR